MRNIPDFTCEYGAAQLILEDIDRNRKAYCLILWAVEGQLSQLLEECARFCSMVGAEQTFALLPQNLHPEADFPYTTAFQVVEMEVSRVALGSSDCTLLPLLPENAGEYVERYNEAMAQVEGARRLSEKEIPRLLDRGGCWFIQQRGQLVGLGQVEEDQILALAALIAGAGETVVKALATRIVGDVVRLSVADTNVRAMKLYARLGFTPTQVLETWWGVGK